MVSLKRPWPSNAHPYRQHGRKGQVLQQRNTGRMLGLGLGQEVTLGLALMGRLAFKPRVQGASVVMRPLVWTQAKS